MAGRRKFALPTMSVYIEGPLIFTESRDLNRKMTDAFKEGMKESLLFHHKAYMPLHFNANNRTRYGHEKRSDFYRWWKLTRYKSRTDLVRSGRTKRKITGQSPALTTRGAVGAKGAVATATYEFPTEFRQAGPNADPRHVMKFLQYVKVTPQIMAMEIAKVLPSEALAMNRVVHKKYNEKMRHLFRGRKKWRNKFGKELL